MKTDNNSTPVQSSSSLSISSNEVLDYLYEKDLISQSSYEYLSTSSKERFKTKFVFCMCKTLALDVMSLQEKLKERKENGEKNEEKDRNFE